MTRKPLNYEKAKELVDNYILAVEKASKDYNGNDSLNYAYMCGAFTSLLKQLCMTRDVGATIVEETRFMQSPLSQ